MLIFPTVAPPLQGMSSTWGRSLSYPGPEGRSFSYSGSKGRSFSYSGPEGRSLAYLEPEGAEPPEPSPEFNP